MTMKPLDAWDSVLGDCSDEDEPAPVADPRQGLPRNISAEQFEALPASKQRLYELTPAAAASRAETEGKDGWRSWSRGDFQVELNVITAKVLKRPIAPTTSLPDEAGLDSLAALELSEAISARFGGMKIEPAELIRLGSVRAIAGRLATVQESWGDSLPKGTRS